MYLLVFLLFLTDIGCSQHDLTPYPRRIWGFETDWAYLPWAGMLFFCLRVQLAEDILQFAHIISQLAHESVAAHAVMVYDTDILYKTSQTERKLLK